MAKLLRTYAYTYPMIQPIPKCYTNSEVLITIENEEIEHGHLQELRINYKRIHFWKGKVVYINIEQRGMSETFAYQFLSFLFLSPWKFEKCLVRSSSSPPSPLRLSLCCCCWCVSRLRRCVRELLFQKPQNGPKLRSKKVGPNNIKQVLKQV